MDERVAEVEKRVFLVAISAFLGLSMIFLGSALVAKDMTGMLWRVAIGACCFAFAIFW